MGLKEVSSDYTVSLHYDRRLYRQDIEGSIAHARMLAKQEIIEQADASAIVDGLSRIREDIESNEFPWRPEHEDIHMNIELRLHELIGEPALKLHTARSRNDQVALDMRMYMKEIISETLNALHGLRRSLVQLADDNTEVVMPGYTHLQRAQPVLFAHHMLAYFEMFGRDQLRFQQAYERADVMPLGSGALAGLPYPLDREFVRQELGFAQISDNSMDAVSDRDFMLDFLSAASICAMHISRFAEELVLWSTDEFDFVRLSDDYTTGSSIMPQKRNPDFAEIARGKTGRVYGNLFGLLTTLKGLPLTYNRDLQEDKEGLFDTVDTLIPTLTIFADMLSKMSLNKTRLLDAAQGSYVLATDIADYLVSQGVPFREAHRIVSALSQDLAAQGRQFHELTLEEYKKSSPFFDVDVLKITVESSVSARNVPGGTSFESVSGAIIAAKALLEGKNRA
ncbi:MAG TPA: argininosuccinate lyase [Dehalococcoidia bacterium]|nr:argininosuccinate lyase [Dehalococcoidia bacterium]